MQRSLKDTLALKHLKDPALAPTTILHRLEAIAIKERNEKCVNLVTTSKAPVTTSVALVTSSKALVSSSFLLLEALLLGTNISLEAFRFSGQGWK